MCSSVQTCSHRNTHCFSAECLVVSVRTLLSLFVTFEGGGSRDGPGAPGGTATGLGAGFAFCRLGSGTCESSLALSVIYYVK